MGVSKKNKQYCIVFFCTVCVIFGTLLSYVFVFDPWHLFHQSWFRPPVFIKNARFQNAGIINSYSFDSVIIGSSMAENFSAQEASEQLGGIFVNLSMAGSLLSERYIVWKHLFKTKDVEKIIITLDHSPYVAVGEYNKDILPEKYDFLYNWNPVDDFRIYFDVNLFKCWDLNTSCFEEVPGVRKRTFHELYSWFPYYEKAFGGVDAWCYWTTQSAPFKIFIEDTINLQRAIEAGKTSPLKEEVIIEYQQNNNSTFDTYLLSVIQENPDVQFLLFFPPYSRLWYSTWEQYYTGHFRTYLSFIEHVVQTTNSYPNVLVFGFDNMDFTANLAHYKDHSHYHKDINSKILQLMSRQENVLTKDNIAGYLQEISQLAHEYDLKGITNEFEACLNQ